MTPRPLVACAVLGREHDILLIRHPTGDCVLPSAPVQPGEWVEHALDRAVRDTLGVAVTSASFLCLVEDADGLFIIFDVTPEATNIATPAHQPDCFWASLDQLSTLDLRPPALRTVLQLADPPPWIPHHST